MEKLLCAAREPAITYRLAQKVLLQLLQAALCPGQMLSEHLRQGDGIILKGEEDKHRSPPPPHSPSQFLSFLLALWTLAPSSSSSSSGLCVGAGTIRKAQNLLKQYSQHGLDGKKGGSNLTPLEGNAPWPPLWRPPLSLSLSLCGVTCVALPR